MQSEANVSAGQTALQQENARLKEAYEAARGASGAYAHVAYALARDYTDLFYVNVETGEFVEYRSDDECGMLLEARRADGFFESCMREAKLFVHPDDQDAFVAAMSRARLLAVLDRYGEHEMTYRRMMDGRSFYVQMRVSRMRDDGRYIVVAVTDIDELVMKRREEERIREERVVYARLHAVAGNQIVVYVVNPQSDHFREFSSIDAYGRSFDLEKEGQDFFGRSRETTRCHIHPQDSDRFLAAFTKENVMAAIERDGIYTLAYRLMLDGRSRTGMPT